MGAIMANKITIITNADINAGRYVMADDVIRTRFQIVTRTAPGSRGSGRHAIPATITVNGERVAARYAGHTRMVYAGHTIGDVFDAADQHHVIRAAVPIRGDMEHVLASGAPYVYHVPRPSASAASEPAASPDAVARAHLRAMSADERAAYIASLDDSE